MDEQLESIIDKQFNELIKDFKPSFGNTTHIQIVEINKEIEKLSKELKLKIQNAKGVVKVKEDLSRLKRNVIYLLKQ